MKFRFYITDISEGNVVGTNDKAVAYEIAQSEDYYVVDTETGDWIMADGEATAIEETTYTLNPQEPDSEDGPTSDDILP